MRWRRQVEEAVELGFDRPSIGYDRLAHPGAPHAAHLDAVVAVEAELDSIVAGRGARVMSAILIPNC